MTATLANISRSVVTTAIGGLERQLGATLFERNKSGITLTYEVHASLQQGTGWHTCGPSMRRSVANT